jgi:hypothetical protein
MNLEDLSTTQMVQKLSDAELLAVCHQMPHRIAAGLAAAGLRYIASGRFLSFEDIPSEGGQEHVTE